jgi:membrane protein YqaA with SNARE-associated domain
MIRENLTKALAGLLILIIVLSLLGFWFEEELMTATNSMVDRIGFAGLCLILLITDTLVTPVSPDLLLVVIAKSDLADHWVRYVFVLSVVSVLAGMLGWSIGRRLGHLKRVSRYFDQFDEKQRRFIRRYGFWAIALGAVTPLPYSVTCWTAGAVGVSAKTALAASVLFRIPRIFLYYLIIAATGTWFG